MLVFYIILKLCSYYHINIVKIKVLSTHIIKKMTWLDRDLPSMNM